jgi:hypothetical protein
MTKKHDDEPETGHEGHPTSDKADHSDDAKKSPAMRRADTSDGESPNT